MTFTYHQPCSREVRTKDSPSLEAFSLLEVLAAMTIIASIIGLAAYAFPNLGAVLRGSQLTQAAQMVVDSLAMARQVSVARNRCVEVRFYEFSTPGTEEKGRYRAMQTFEVAESGLIIPMGSVQGFPPSVRIDPTDEFSSIIGSAGAKPASPTAVSGDELGFPLPGVGTRYSAVTFRFLPNGSTSLLPLSEQWFITLRSDGEKAPADLPRNFVTVQIDPTNGHIQTFRR